jgi:hypothetical protein
MTTQAPLKTPEREAALVLPERETAPLQVIDTDPVANPFRLLDPRCRSRAVVPGMARRGPHLAFETGDGTRLVPLAEKITHIGRGVQAEIRLDDQRTSRSHAIIVRHGRFARVLDNRSSNGTYLNGRRVVATNLTDGDLLHVGSVEMRYVEIV